MKPLELTMTAFGPYDEKTTIDFFRLHEKAVLLFLINGKTGSGKTVIFDAICYALYGSLPAGREAKAMRCRQSPDTRLCEVQFRFSVGENTYRIVRTPEQTVAKKRGSGFTEQKATAVLEQLGANGETIKLINKKVDQAVEELLGGLKKEQFCQVILLPQGEFREFLRADTNKKSALLSRLFNTDIYGALTARLKDREKELRQQLEAAANERRLKLADVVGDDETALTDEAAAERLAALKAERDILQGKAASAAEATAAANQHLSEGKTLEGKFAERDAAQREADKLAARQGEITGLEKSLAIAERAREIKPDYDNLCQSEKEAAQKMREAAAAQQAAEKAELDRKKAEIARQKAAAEETETERLKGELVRLNGFIDLADSYVGLAGALKQTQEKQTAARKELDAQTAAQNRLKAEKEKLETEREAAKEKALQREGYQLKVAELAKESATAKEKAALSAQLIEQRQKIARLEQRAQDLREAAAKKQLVYEIFQEKWTGGQAAIMAENLADGTPCPVCGATHHPAPARRAADLPSDNAVKQAKSEADAARKMADDFLPQLAAAKEKLSALTAKIEAVKSERDAAEVARALAQAEKELKASIESERLLTAKIVPALAENAEKIAAAAAKIDELSQAERNAANDVIALREALKQKEAILPPEYRDGAKVRTAIAKMQANIARREKYREQAKAQFDAANITAAEAGSSAAEREKAAIELNEKLARAREEFAAKSAAGGFENADEYAAAAKNIAFIEQYRRIINEYAAKKQSAADRLASAAAAIKDKERPDLAALSEKFAAAKKAENDLHIAIGQAKAQVKQLEATIGQIKRLNEKIAQLETLYQPASKLAALASGANGENLNFQNYVLQIFLDDVTRAANDRLLAMTEQRYSLKRTGEKTNSKGGRASLGLDLIVYDDYSGDERPVATLSGGESFMAALSLALGLADVVMEYQGGIRLDAVFIDEGFGTLDEESLDRALTVLEKLNGDETGGGRLIGLISHVSELEKRIPVHLDVRQNGSGTSTASFSGLPA